MDIFNTKEIIYNYITTNIVNNKQYVGMHCTSNIDDGYLGSGTLLWKSIKKYGKDKFVRKILCDCDRKEEAHLNEAKYIIEFKTLAPNGYNLRPDGGGISQYGLKHLIKIEESIIRQEELFKHCPEVLEKLKQDFIEFRIMPKEEWGTEKYNNFMLSFGWNKSTNSFSNERLIWKLIENEYEKRKQKAQ